jgi:hypothetical protein
MRQKLHAGAPTTATTRPTPRLETRPVALEHLDHDDAWMPTLLLRPSHPYARV